MKVLSIGLKILITFLIITVTSAVYQFAVEKIGHGAESALINWAGGAIIILIWVPKSWWTKWRKTN